MAINPLAKYAGRTDNSDPTGYPYGKCQNESAPSANDGTPSDEAWMNDLWGLFQALLSGAGISPSGTPDKVGASDYLDSLQVLFAGIADGRFPTADQKAALAGTDGSPSVSNKYVTNTDSRILSQDENDAAVGTSGTPSSANKYVTDADPRLGSGPTVQALALIDMTGPSLISGVNIASLASAAAGDITISFTAPITTANYVPVGMAQYLSAPFGDSANPSVGLSRRTTTPLLVGSARLSCTINVTGTAVAVDSPLLAVAFIG